MSTPYDSLSPEERSRLDPLIDAFEQALNAGDSPDIESSLAEVDPHLMVPLLAELMYLEVERRQKLEDHVSQGDYVSRFADHADVVNWVFASLDTDSNRPTAGHAHKQANAEYAGLHVRCPHCHNPIELVPDAPLEDIECASCGSSFSLVSGDATDTRAAGPISELGNFKLIDRVGMGAFGSVWKAHDTKLDRTVAIKIPRKGQFDKKQEKSFLREAQSAAQLSHPGIVPVYEVGREGDTLFIVSQYVRGLTLADWLTGQQPSLREAAELVIKIAGALEHAHQRGVIHRDLKPGNIMLDDDLEPHVMDFGLAKREATEITMTVDGQLLGTPAYMSPEQARGEASKADARSDVYSLGVILYQLLTGELPFRGNARMLLHQVVNDDPPSPRKLNNALPRDLETITLKCLEKDIKRRVASAADLGAELNRWLHLKPIKSRPITVFERGCRWASRHRTIASLSAVVAALLTSIAIGATVATVRYRGIVKSQEQTLRENTRLLLEEKAAKAESDALVRFFEESLERIS